MSVPSTKISLPRRTKDTLTVWLGIIFLVGLIGAGWFPRECPVLRQALSSCPASRGVSNAPQTDDEKDIARIPHQAVRNGLAGFSVGYQENREQVVVNFSYRSDPTLHVAYFSIDMKDGKQRLSLITHPLLVNLNWPRLSDSAPDLSLYQRTGSSDKLDSFRQALPPASQLAADSIAADLWSLSETEYTPLESLTTLEGINYILTTYSPPIPDGGWSGFHHTFNLSNALVSPSNELGGQIEVVKGISSSTPFLISTVHLDYRFSR